MTEPMKCIGHEHLAVFPTLIPNVLSAHQIIGESKIHARTLLDIHRYCSLIVSGFIQILKHRGILAKHKTIKFIDFLHTDRQTDMVKLIGQFLQNFDAKA